MVDAVTAAIERRAVAITLYHHPFSRAAGVLWMLEEVGVPYELHHVDFATRAQKAPEILALNPMGKLPILTDGDQVVTEGTAIGLYLADRYSAGKLAPSFDDPARGTYLRWSLFAPSVIEPGSMARLNHWQFKSSQAGWGDYEAMLSAIDSAVSAGDYLLGDRFTMADIIFGGTLRYMLRFGMLEKRPVFDTYVGRLAKRPALQKADEINQKIVVERGLGT